MRLGVVSDLHLTLDPEARGAWHNPFDFAGVPARIDAARDLFARAGVDAVAVCGDVAHDGDEPATRAALERVSDGRPLLVVAGNHDCVERDDRLGRCLAGADALLPVAGVDVGGVSVAAVPVERDEDGSMRWTGAAPGDGARVVLSHFPVVSRALRFAQHGLAYPGDLTNRAELEERLTGDAPTVVLSGHIHARESHARGNLLQLSAGALIEAPHEAAVLEVDRDGGALRVRRRVHELGPAPAGPDPVLAPGDETWVFAAGGWHAV